MDGIVVSSGFHAASELRRRFSTGLGPGTDANTARIIQGYAQGAIGQWSARRTAQGIEAAGGPVLIQERIWFNETNDSHYFLVPGLIVLIMTLIGALLTALVMAREWERGTIESLFVTPVRSGEILLGKTIPYFALGMIGLALCVVAAKYMFHVPIRGSITVLAIASMYIAGSTSNAFSFHRRPKANSWPQINDAGDYLAALMLSASYSTCMPESR